MILEEAEDVIPKARMGVGDDEKVQAIQNKTNLVQNSTNLIANKMN